ncbi:MAG: hypothetical protein ACM34K_00805 [Bacillota bacterium]
MRFLFTDKITEISGCHIKGIKRVSFEEGFIDQLSAETGSLPRLLMMESAAQFVSWLILYNTNFTKIPLIASIDHAEIYESVRCGEYFTVEVTVESINSEGAVVNSLLYRDGKKIAFGQRCMCTLIDAEKLVSIESLKSRFSELIRDGES